MACSHLCSNSSGTLLLICNGANNIDVFERNDLLQFKFKTQIDIKGKGFVSSLFVNNAFLIGCRDGALLEICASKLEVIR